MKQTKTPITKKQITEELARLRKYGFKVKVNQENRMKRTGQKGLADYMIFKDKFYWLEAKIGKDTPSPEQTELMNIMQGISEKTNMVYAGYITDENYKQIVDNILSGVL